MGYSFSEVKKIVFFLLEQEYLGNIIYFAGGVVPWIISDNDSNREHSDIDIVVEESNMFLVRKYLKENGYYKKQNDSKHFSFNSKNLDFGLEAQINGITVNIAPFVLKKDCIIQRNFSLNQTGETFLLQATLKDIDDKKFFSQTSIQCDLIFKSYSLETVKAAKSKSNRDKDKIDIQQIDTIGINQKDFLRLVNSFDNMQLEIISKGKHR
ncbi:hypothetical protein HQ708_07045 [Enterococcus faecium]|nr:hypothetical protein [Enterococcus faecium]